MTQVAWIPYVRVSLHRRVVPQLRVEDPGDDGGDGRPHPVLLLEGDEGEPVEDQPLEEGHV